MQPTRDIQTLLAIMVALRDPKTGCPWDVEQDFSTIAPYTLEEAYEVIDAIERDDMDDLREELGDLLLQVVFHSRISEEKGGFNFGHVVEAVTTKMIRRHPHVFGDEEARTAGMAKGSWNRIKQIEKDERIARRTALGLDSPEKKGFLDDVPDYVPALVSSLKYQQKAARVGFDWAEAAPILDKVAEEAQELREAMNNQDQAHIEEEYGDLLFAMVNLGRHLNLEPEMALRAANNKFKRRFHHIEDALNSNDSSLEAATLDEMEALWNKAKQAGK